MQNNDNAAKTIKTDLSVIRFWHDKISDPRHKLPNNTVFDLERCVNGDKDRSWSHDEFTKMLAITIDKEREDYVTALTLAYYAGLDRGYYLPYWRQSPFELISQVQF